MDVIKNYIDGQMVESSSSRTADVMNPATGEVQAQVRLSSKDELDAAVAKAAEAQKAWGATNPRSAMPCARSSAGSSSSLRFATRPRPWANASMPSWPLSTGPRVRLPGRAKLRRSEARRDTRPRYPSRGF